jgi:small subunit ribosomal protein S12
MVQIHPFPLLFFTVIKMTIHKLIIKNTRRKKSHKRNTFLLNKCPQRKATCLKVTFMAPKKPNSATRKVAKVTFAKGKRSTFSYIPGIKHNLQKFSTVLLRGGRTKDLPGLKYKLIRGVYDLKAVANRFKARSKYGIKNLSRSEYV